MNKDYIVIYIKEMSTEEIKQAMDLAIEKIKKDTTIFTFIINFNYYLLFSYFSYFFKSTFYVNSMMFIHKDLSYLVQKPLCITVHDNGIQILTNFIPYENISIFGYTAGIVDLDILGSIDSKLKLELNNNKTRISINCLNGTKLINLIKKNMYYHIRYNKINTEVISFYKST